MATDGKSLSVRAGWWAVGLLAALAGGCVTTENSVGGEKPPAPGVACQVVATWQNCVAYAADPTRGGVMAPGLAGRVYLFGPKIDYPMTGDGSLLVEMFDETQGTPVKREQWDIDAKTLQRLLRHDFIGWGYTLFLPSGEYKPEMSKLRLRTCYRPAKGAPLYSENMVTLDAGNGVVHSENKTQPLPLPQLAGR